MERPPAKEIDRLLGAALAGGGVYAVGGRVRDEVLAELGRPSDFPPDLDYLVTGVPMSEIVRRLSALGKAELVGAAFGIIKFTKDGVTVDVALPRRERSTGAHHREFAVEASPDIPIEEDLARRDFRINMMARDLRTGTLVDPYGGRADLERRRLDIMRPEAFLEDPLRILRGAQFSARFELTTTSGVLSAMGEAAQLLPTVAAERMADELTKLIVRARKPSVGFELLREAGALSYVLPELLEGWGVDQNVFHRYSVYHHSLQSCDQAPRELAIRLAALLHDIGKPRTKEGPHFYRHEFVGADMAREALNRLRFPMEVVDRAAHLIAHHMYAIDDEISDAGVRRFIRRVGPQNVDELFALRHADRLATGLPLKDGGQNERFEARVHAQLAAPHVFSLSDLAIDGEQVMQIMRELRLADEKFRGDKRVGEALRHCLEQVLENPADNEPERLRAIVRAYFAAN